jgi:hypothetical protein
VYCSKACQFAGTTFDIICKVCEKPFKVLRSKRASAVYCSRACQFNKDHRFWSKVEKCSVARIGYDDIGPCWEWVAARNALGYGVCGQLGQQSAHRASWVLHHGQIPVGAHVLHRCDNPSCVRPDHLFLGTHQENMTDMRVKGRARGKDQDGESHATHKLTEEQVREIRSRHAAGAKQKDLAPEFMVHKATINDVVLRKTWTHL